jgi:serine/threonine protein kinase
MDSGLEKAYNDIMSAVRAEDLFGELNLSGQSLSMEHALAQAYDRLKSVVDPELYKRSPDDKDLAADALSRLNQFFERAKARLGNGVYGSTQQRPSLKKVGSVSIKTATREYYLGEQIAEGTIATIYDGECAIRDEFAGRVAIKIMNSSADNELAWREAKALEMLHKGNGPQRKHLPVLLDRFQTSDQRVGLVFRYIEESQDMYTILDQPEHADGVDRKHMVWMLNRILSAVGYAHNLGIVHGNIEPAHLLVRGRDHNVFVIDWAWSAISPAKTGDQFKVFTEHFSAPEVKKQGPPHPASDIYSIGKCMIYLLGGNVETNEMPDSVEPKIQRYLEYLVTESMAQRPHDAWDQWRFLDTLVRELWGKKRFIPFTTK